MRHISERFVRLRKKGRTAAWAALQEELMGNADILIPEVLTFKDFISASVEVENFLKSEEGIRSEDPMESIRKFLLGEESVASDRLN